MKNIKTKSTSKAIIAVVALLIIFALVAVITLSLGNSEIRQANANPFHGDLTFALAGGGAYYRVSASNTNITQAVIPAEYLGKPVKEIATNGFASRTQLTRVYIPESVTTIGNGAFLGCTSLSYVVITGAETIGSNAFNLCGNLKIAVVNEGAQLGNNAFNSAVTTVKTQSYPKGTLAWDTWQDIYEEDDIYHNVKCTHPSISYTPILDNASNPIGYSVNAISISDPTAVLELDYYLGLPILYVEQLAFAFAEFKAVAFGRHSTHAIEIADYAFFASDIQSVWFGDSVIFEDSHLVSGITMDSESTFLFSEVKTVVLPDTLTAINTYMFSFCMELTTVMHISSTDINVLSDNIVSIGNGAFEGCTEIAELYIYGNVLTMGVTVFFGWESNQTVHVKDFYEQQLPVGWHADWNQGSNADFKFKPIEAVWVTLDFEGGTGADTFVIAYAFSPMPSATAPTRVGYVFAGYFCGQFGTGVKYYNANMTSATNWDQFNNTTLYAYWTDLYLYQLNTSTMEYTLTGVVWNLSAFFNTITHLEIPSEYNGLPVTAIGQNAFRNRSYFASVIMPDTITHIGNSAFEGCFNLTYIKLSENLLEICEYAFAFSNRIENIVFPSTLTTIAQGAFFEASIRTAIIHANVTSIGNSAFRSRSWDTTIYTEVAGAPTPPPAGWMGTWTYAPFFWGCTLSADKDYVVSFVRTNSNPTVRMGLSAPYREGYTFDGWKDPITNSTYQMNQLNSVPNGTTLFAIWQ
ncbi:MAG: leucine-rich repeat protein [Firmicutes bacterium]|nr:leucine-rich repeat protein [Bacillota bacterium]